MLMDLYNLPYKKMNNYSYFQTLLKKIKIILTKMNLNFICQIIDI